MERSSAVPDSERVLILGGTGEARALADALAQHPGVEVITSLAGRTVAPRLPKGELRVGGFGGGAGLADYIARQNIEAVIDATHPYAAAISRHAVEAAGIAGRPLLRLERAAWTPVPGDHWFVIDSLAGALEVAPRLGSRVFLTIGTKEVAAFAGAQTLWFLVRLVERPEGPLPLPNHEIILGRGPFAEADEIELMEKHRIDVVVAKNSGGQATYGKIAAARRLGIPVMLLRRPPLPPAETATSIEQAVAWVERRLAG
jgi:precorrin-6A/cobalt-precorrin-6A reductase